MTVIIKDSDPEVARAVADLVEDRLSQLSVGLSGGAAPRLGVATGATFEPVYAELAERAHARSVLAGTSLLLLDEYVGLAGDDPASYRTFIRTRLADRVRAGGSQATSDPTPDGPIVDAPNGTALDVNREAQRYEQAVLARPIDLQLLGLGRNGHIGFNEPGSSLASRTRVVRLCRATRSVNARYFPSLGQAPTHAITQGVGTILEAASIVLVATGPHKASAVARALEGPVTTAIPASALQLHPDVTYVLDRPSASELTFSLELALASERSAYS